MGTRDVSEALAAGIEQFALALARNRGLADLDPVPLTITQRAALRLIVDHEPLHSRTLARLLATTEPTATRTVDALEAQGLATRVRDPADGRAVLISPTKQGRRHVEETRRRLIARLRVGLDQMPRADQERLAALLLQLGRLLDPGEGSAGPS